MEKVKLFYTILDSGDGSASVQYYLSLDSINKHEDYMIREGYEFFSLGEGTLETFVGSDCYNLALKKEAEIEN
jgi:hypothetical protein